MTHPEVRKEFEKNKVPIPLNAPDIVEEEFFRQTLPDTRKTKVNHIIRVMRGDREYLLSDEVLYGETLEGMPRYLPKTFGKYPFPHFVKAYNPATGRTEANGRIDNYEERYDIPSSPSAIKKLLEKDQFGTQTGMTIDLGGIQFAVTNKQDFINLPAEKLVAKITGKDPSTIVGTPQAFVTTAQKDADGDEDDKPRGNTEQEQREARDRMYDFSMITNSSSTFGPTIEQRAAALPTLAPQPTLNVAPSNVTLSPQDVQNKSMEEINKTQRERNEQEAEARQEQVEIQQKDSEKPGEPKKGVGQSRARERISEDVGVVLKHEDTGVKENMTKDSITIEEPQGQAAKDLMDKDRREQQQQQKAKENKR